MDNSATAVK